MKKRAPSSTPDPRAAALTILDQLDRNESTLDALLDAAAAETAALSRRDRALFNQLVYGTLRWRGNLDGVVAAFADRPLSQISSAILNILRLALFQIRFMDRIPPSAAVNTAVNLARRENKTARAAGFVNALLRNALREPERFRLPDATADPVAHLAMAKSFPPWLVSRWITRMGVAETARLCDAMNTIPPITLRCNARKNSLDELRQALAGEARRLETRTEVPGALDLIGPRRPIVAMQAFADGRFAVQDLAAQLVCRMLAPRPGETVLDACAGLGGKTTHLAQLMEDRGTLVAMDNAAAKLERLEAEARRLDLSMIQTRAMDLNRPPDPARLPRFDRVLLDAPCSGLGVLRRNPDAKWSARKKQIGRFARRQARFLTHLAPLVKPNGILLYVVCSLEPEENQRVVETFLKKQANFAITAPQVMEAASVRPFLNDNGFFQTVPHIHHMDGFFAARLQRID